MAFSDLAIKRILSMTISRSVEGIRIIWVRERIASMSREGALATRMNLLAMPTVSIILRR